MATYYYHHHFAIKDIDEETKRHALVQMMEDFLHSAPTWRTGRRLMIETLRLEWTYLKTTDRGFQRIPCAVTYPAVKDYDMLEVRISCEFE